MGRSLDWHMDGYMRGCLDRHWDVPVSGRLDWHGDGYMSGCLDRHWNGPMGGSLYEHREIRI